MYTIYDRTREEINAEKALLNYPEIKKILEENKKIKINKKETVYDVWKSAIDTIREEYQEDEMAEDLQPLVKKIFYAATACEKKFGIKIIKKPISIKKAEENFDALFRVHTLCMAVNDIPEIIGMPDLL